VPYDVRSEWASPRVLAAIRETTTRQRLGADIVRFLNVVWPVLREQGVRTDHNVVVYRGGADDTLIPGFRRIRGVPGYVGRKPAGHSPETSAKT